MCEQNVYLRKNGQEELIMEAVDRIEPEEEHGYRLVGIFGDQKLIRGRLVHMSLVNHRIVFEAEGVGPTFCQARPDSAEPRFPPA